MLDIQSLAGGFRAPDGGTKQVLHNVSCQLMAGRITAIVGESGSGKSLTALSILGIAPPAFALTAGRILFHDADLLTMSDTELRRVRGRQIAMVFQDARAALNPVFPVGRQLADIHRLHHASTGTTARRAAIEALEQVRIPEAERRARQYPHEFSGGMAQRVMIAMAALICQPELLILDEPTTGLDVTIQADIMDLITDLCRTRNLTAALITHDLGIVAESADHVVVMQAGAVVESGATAAIFNAPRHAYTQRLLAASRLA